MRFAYETRAEAVTQRDKAGSAAGAEARGEETSSLCEPAKQTREIEA